MRMIKRRIVSGLESFCEWTHPITHHFPWVYLPIHNVHCLPATLSSYLDKRWGTEVWSTVPDDDPMFR